MIKSLRVRNFKSYIDAEMKLSRVTFLIGANAAGKSNALDALRFLNWMGRGERLDDIETRLGAAPGQIRGTQIELFRQGESTFDFRIEVEDGASYDFHQGISCRSRNDAGVESSFMAVSSESLKCPDEKLPLYSLRRYQISEYAESVSVEYNNFSRGRNKPSVSCSNRQAIFYQLMSESRFDNPKSKERIPAVARIMKDSFGQMLFLDADLTKMRGYTRKIKGRMLNTDASNISSVLFNICQNAETKADLLDIIKSLPEQDIRDVSFVETEIGDVMMQLDEGLGLGRSTPATLLSDGTLRLLAIAAGILSAPRNELVVIEEIDNGIHPSRAKHIVEQLYRIAEKRDIQILLTTHNPALMSAVPTNRLGEVLCCYRNSETGGSEILQLAQSMRFAELSARGKLGDLATSDELSEIIKDGRTREQIKKERRLQLDMLERLFSEGE